MQFLEYISNWDLGEESSTYFVNLRLANRKHGGMNVLSIIAESLSVSIDTQQHHSINEQRGEYYGFVLYSSHLSGELPTAKESYLPYDSRSV